MSLMKNICIAPALLTAILSSNMSFAQTETTANAPAQPAVSTTKKAPPYGDNPNIFKVFAYKTTDKVVDTAEKVGDATERGIDKLKPKVDEAWDKVTGKHTVDVPIENKSLSQSSNNELAPTNTKVVPPAAATPVQPSPAPATVPATPLTPANKVPATPNKVPEPVKPAEAQKPLEQVKPTTLQTTPTSPSNSNNATIRL